jgi:hypothetical protein
MPRTLFEKIGCCLAVDYKSNGDLNVLPGMLMDLNEKKMLRKKMSSIGQHTIDGCGAKRVIKEIFNN